MIVSSSLRDGIFMFCDIRDSSAWIQRNQQEAASLIDIFYSAAFDNIGTRREQEYPHRVAKLLGDGFFAVYEYESQRKKTFQDAINALIENTIAFRIDFYNRLAESTLHGKRSIRCGFGISYGKAVRFTIPGFPIDYLSDKINYASRLAGVAGKNEAVFEEDMWEYIDDETVFNKRKDKRNLKKMGKTLVGLFDVDS